MNLKKRVAAGAAAFLTAVLLAVPAYAHGGGHHSYVQTVRPVQTQTTVYTCPVEGCQVTGTHTHHNGVTHTGGYVCDGTCAALCTVENCTAAGRHTHDGVTYYCGYDHAGGFCDGTCVALCTVEGCTASGRHTHNGVTYYCGYDHANGFCDGTCATAAVQQPAAVPAATTTVPAATAAVPASHHGSGHHGCH